MLMLRLAPCLNITPTPVIITHFDLVQRALCLSLMGPGLGGRGVEQCERPTEESAGGVCVCVCVCVCGACRPDSVSITEQEQK